MFKYKYWIVLLIAGWMLVPSQLYAQKDYSKLIRAKVYEGYTEMFREAGGGLEYPFMTPGSEQYPDILWDWDSWLSNVALRQILLEKASEKERKEALKYEQGCVLNFLKVCRADGWIPINMGRDWNVEEKKPENIYTTNMHKPCLAQHAAFLVQVGEDSEWLRTDFFKLQFFIRNYQSHQFHKATGLFYWQDDHSIGVDNDPSTFYRPPGSSGSIYLNCMMFKELKAMAFLADELGLGPIASEYEKNASDLKAAIQKHCWDERDGFFYSVDLNLLPVEKEEKWKLHTGAPRSWDCLIQRLGVWSGFMALWSGIATPEQAERMVKEHLLDSATFNAPNGVRTLSKMEKMYNVTAMGNPSSWLGPIWGVSNYMTWRGLEDYGFELEAKDLAAKTINMFGRDFERSGVLHEYYEPETGQPVLNPGFQNWNYLELNMLAWMEGKKVIKEF